MNNPCNCEQSKDLTYALKDIKSLIKFTASVGDVTSKVRDMIDEYINEILNKWSEK